MGTLETVIRAGMDWPPKRHADRIATQEGYALLARNKRHEVVQEHSVDLLRYVDVEQDVVPFPSVRIAARTLAAFLFGEEPTVTHDAADVTAALRDFMVDTNATATLLDAAYDLSVQGRIFLRPTWDEDVSPDHAILDAIEGRKVIDLYRYGRLQEAAVVTAWDAGRDDGRLLGSAVTVWRFIEIYSRGTIIRRLYAGSRDRLGSERPLTDQPDTADYEPMVDTGLDHVGLVPVHTPFGGLSVFDGLEGMVLAMHRLYSQDQHDAEMARRKIAVSEEYITRTATGTPVMDRRTDLFVMNEEAAAAVGSESGSPVTPIEFSDDLVMTERLQARFRDFLIACGIAPDTIDANESGGAISGTARRLAQAMTIQTVSAMGRHFRFGLAEALPLCLTIERDMLGLPVPDPSTGSTIVTLADGFVDDPVEQATILSTLDTAEAISTRQKVRTLHPDWDDDAVDQEVEAIGSAAPPAVTSVDTGTPDGVAAAVDAIRAGTGRRAPAADV